MKKIFLFFSAIFIFTGCGGGQATKPEIKKEEKVVVKEVKKPSIKELQMNIEKEIESIKSKLDDTEIDNFERGKANIPSEKWERFAKMAAPVIKKILPRIPEDYVIQVTGHTDSTGTNEINRELSEKRAEAVYNALKKHGIDSEKLTYKGVGISMLIKGVDTEDGKQRRVTFEIVKK